MINLLPTPKTLAFKGGILNHAGANRAPGAEAYLELVTGKIHAIYHGHVTSTGPHYALVQVEGNRTLTSVRVDCASLGGNVVLRPGDALLLGNVEFLATCPRAKSAWLLPPTARPTPRRKPTPAPLPVRKVGVITRAALAPAFGEILTEGTGTRIAPPPHRQGSCHSRRAYEWRSTLPAFTDFGAFRDKRLLCLVDDDNLRISARQQHRGRLSYRLLLAQLQRVAANVIPVCVLTAEPGNRRRADYLRNRGWQVLSVPREVVRTCHGPLVKGNADTDIAFEAGRLAARCPCDVLLLASGDGDLCVSISRGIKRSSPAPQVYTMAVSGSASHRLTERTDLFAGSIVIGRDLTRLG